MSPQAQLAFPILPDSADEEVRVYFMHMQMCVARSILSEGEKSPVSWTGWAHRMRLPEDASRREPELEATGGSLLL